jgi:hypothetical protein
VVVSISEGVTPAGGSGPAWIINTSIALALTLEASIRRGGLLAEAKREFERREEG